MTKKNNSLNRARVSTVTHLACRLMSDSSYRSYLQEGLVLRIVVVSPFKAIAQWYQQQGPGVLEQSEVSLESIPVAIQERLYIVDRTENKLAYWWRRNKFGQGLFLRPVRTRDRLAQNMQLLKTREMYLSLAY